LRSVPVVVVFSDPDRVLAVDHVVGTHAVGARGGHAVVEDRRARPCGRSVLAVVGAGRRREGLGFLLGLPYGDVSAITLHVQGGVVIEDRPLGFGDVLPLVGDRAGKVPETDLSVGLAVPPGFRRVGNDALDGGNGFLRGPLVGESLHDARSRVLEENVVGTQGALRLVLGLLPRPSLRRGLALGGALGARAPGRSRRVDRSDGFVGIPSRKCSSGFRRNTTGVLRLINAVAAAAAVLEFDVDVVAATGIVQARPLLGERSRVDCACAGNVPGPIHFDYVHVDVHGSRIDGLVNCDGGVATV